MNILMISGDTSLAQGYQGTFYNTLTEFAAYWDKMDILTPRVPGLTRYDCFHNVTFYPSPWPRVLQPLFIWRKGQQLATGRKYDLIVSHDYGLFLNGMGASRLSHTVGVPYVSEIHHVDGYPKAATACERLQPWLARRHVRRSLPHTLGFRITNEAELWPLLSSWGVPDEKILLLYSLYIDFEIFHPAPAQPEFDAIFCGRLAPNKGLFLFLEGLVRARESFSDLRALIVGRGPLEPQVRKRAVALGLAENIEFRDWVGTQVRLADLYRRSHCLVSTSYSEGGPRVVAEALACGIPVITTRVGLARELVQDGVNGFQIDWSAQEMGDRLAQIVSDQALRPRLSQAAPYAVRRFEKTRVIREYALRYQQLVSR